MRVRILKALTGIIEGHSLSQFIPGQIYQVSADLGLQLLEMDAAIEVRSSDPALTDEDVGIARVAGGVILPPTAEVSTDLPELRRKRR